MYRSPRSFKLQQQITGLDGGGSEAWGRAERPCALPILSSRQLIASNSIKGDMDDGAQGIQTRHRVPRRHRPDVRRIGAGLARAAAREGGRAQRAVHRPGRHRLRPAGLLRQPDRDAEHRRAGRQRTALQQHAHDGALLADALVHPDRPQPSLERDVVHHRGLDRVSRRQRLHPVRERLPVGDPAAAAATTPTPSASGT